MLHANEPAQQWLGGRSTDPWVAGLDADVRARFFQQLAHYDVVNEFEVRWKIGSEVSWAVSELIRPKRAKRERFIR